MEHEFSAYLESVGLSGKEFFIHLETGGKAVVSGLDETQNKQVENYVEEHGEIPQYHMDFIWSGKELKS